MITINAKEIGRTIATLRKNKGETQAELSEAIGVSNSAIAQYEVGMRKPSDDVKIKLAQHFGVSVQDIFFRDIEVEIDDNEVDENLKSLLKKATKEDIALITCITKRLSKTSEDDEKKEFLDAVKELRE